MNKGSNNGFRVSDLSVDLHPYVVFLPSHQKDKMLAAIFGSKAAVGLLKFSLGQGISAKLYQMDLVKKLGYSNKTVIETLKLLTKLGVLAEEMEKVKREKRIVWVKAYQLSDVGKWFALLLANEKDLPVKEKADILRNIFKRYVKWVKSLSEDLHLDKSELKKIFDDEMR